MNEKPRQGYYWAKANFVKEAPKWEIVEVSEIEVWAFRCEVPFDLDDFTFGPEVTKPGGLE